MTEIDVMTSGYDFHPNGCVKASSLLKMLQEAAMKDVTKYGASYEKLRSENKIFVAYKMHLEIDENIELESNAHIRTWGRKGTAVCFERDFVISSCDVINARGSSIWALINYENRHILRKRDMDYSFEEFEESAGIEMFSTIDIKELSLVSETERKVFYSELDINGHMNNTLYADVAVDASPFDMNLYKIKKIMLIYKHEVLPDTVMKLFTYKGENAFAVISKDKQNDNVLFESKIVINEG